MSKKFKPTRKVQIEKITLGGGHSIALIAGPCVIENESQTLKIGEKLKRISNDAEVPLIFKSSYDKANRSSINNFRGPGLNEGLRILKS